MIVPLITSLIALVLEAIPFGESSPAVSRSPGALSASGGGSPAGNAPIPMVQVRRDGGQGFDVVMRCTVPGTAALTFDDGPYMYTNDILGMLKAANATATFFYNGKNFGCIYDQENVERVKSIFYGGHQIASHTWTHADLTTLGWDELNDQMFKVEDAFSKIIGVRPSFMRPPYGKYNDLVLRAANFRQQSVVIWDFDSQDSAGATAEVSKDLYSQIAQKHPDTILTLNHETSDTTVHQVLGHAIAKLQAAGYRLVSVADCLGRPAYSFTGHPQDRDASWTC